MSHLPRRVCIVLIIALFLAPRPALAQADGWEFSVYPVLGWLPIFGADVDVPNIPPPDGGGGGEGGTGGAVKTDTSFNGALFFGFAVEKDRFRVDGYGLWAALGVERPDRPLVDVDLDVIYGTLTGGFALGRDVYATGGVRRVALKYAIRVEDFPTFESKPGIWNPTIGVAWHPDLGRWSLHGLAEYGGFGVGAENEFFASFSADWKPIRNVGLTLGYTLWYFELEGTILENTQFRRTLTASQTLHGPLVGIGIFF